MGRSFYRSSRPTWSAKGILNGVAGLLHVHKHTVRYWLRRVTELTGLDVTRLRDVARLYLAVRAGELLTDPEYTPCFRYRAVGETLGTSRWEEAL